MSQQKKGAVKTEKKARRENSALAKAYLISYNVIQTSGWSYLLFQIVNFYVNYKSTSSLYETVKLTVFIFQTAALLEIYHAAARLVASSPIVTVQQVSSRIIVVWGALVPTAAAQISSGLPLCLLAWAITEIIRYGYYACNIVKLSPKLIIWLRYTLFVVLYPVGITGELLCLYAAQNEFGTTGKWTISLPNNLNFAFSMQYLIVIVMLLYIPIFPQLYMHMFAQRKKILTPDLKKKQ